MIAKRWNDWLSRQIDLWLPTVLVALSVLVVGGIICSAVMKGAQVCGCGE